MSGTDTDDLDVSIEDTPADTSADTAGKEIPPEDGISDLKQQLREERQAREAAEQRAAELAQREHRARIEVDETNLHLVTNAIDTVKRNTELLRSQYAEAMAAGDAAGALKINEAITDNQIKLRDLQNGEKALKDKPKPPAPALDPVEDLASKLTPRSAAWVRAHPEYAQGDKYNEMLSAHSLALARKKVAESDDYFKEVETILGISKKAPPVETDEDPMADTAKPIQRRAAPPAAPVSRDVGGSRIVRLSAAEREAAEASGISPEEYAKNKLLLQKDGRLGRAN